MTEQSVYVSATGDVSLIDDLGDALSIHYDMPDYLGSNAVLDVAFFQVTGTDTPTADNVIARLVWRDDVTNDELYRVEGIVSATVEDSASLLARADAMDDAFYRFDLEYSQLGFESAMQDCDAYNPASTLNRNKVTLTLPVEALPLLDADDLYDQLTLMEPRPAYLVLPNVSSLVVLTAAMRAAIKLNRPLKGDIDPTLMVDQVEQLAEGIEANHQGVEFYWNPNEARPRDAVSTRGMKKPRPVTGWMLGQLLLRNARTNAQGIPPLHIAIAGYAYPLPFKGLQVRGDIKMNDATLKRLAKVRVNPVIREVYGSQTRFVVGDVLTQYNSETSALRLSPSAEIIMYRDNMILDIIKRWMLTGISTFIQSADRECRNFLNACASAGLLKPADDLGGSVYSLTITADPIRKFDAVRVNLGSGVEGNTRAVFLNTSVNK